jgi:CRISPR-associated exonuclease Cas4
MVTFTVLDKEMIITGTQVAYYVVCPTKLWLFYHYTTMEQESDLVSLGSLLQRSFFERAKKDLIVDQKIAIDFIRKGNKLIIHEVKKSSKLENAHVVQLAYYLYYLKYKKMMENVEGIINYPTKRKIVRVTLTEKKEREIKEILNKIREIISLPKPPKPEKKKYCRKCAYFEFCFSE